MVCPKCGKENIKDARYCEWCGIKLKNETAINQKKCICPNCRKESVEDAIYCEWCGAKLKPSDEEEEKYILYNSKVTYGCCIIASGFIFFVGSYFFIEDREGLAQTQHITGSGRFLTGHPDASIIVCLLGIILAGIFLFFCLFNYKKYIKKPWFILDVNGFYSCSRLSGFVGMIGWNEIINFEAKEENKARILIIEFCAKNGDYELTRTYALIENSLLKEQYQKTVRIYTDMLDMEDEELMDLMQRFYDKYGHEISSCDSANAKENPGD